jgi:hypothetical protein
MKRLLFGISSNMNSIAFRTDILIRKNGYALCKGRLANINTVDLSIRVAWV